MSVPVLYGADGQPLVGDDGFLVPHARSFATIWNAVSKTYSYRWDEAIRDNPQNALAMRRDAYLRSLLQERMAPTINRKWQLEVDNDKDPMQVLVRDGLTRIVKAVPRFKRLKYNLMDSLWYGRYGVQFEPFRGQYGWQVKKHIPLNGDKIQYQWDGTPVVFINPIDARVYQARDPESVITSSDKGAILPTDRGAMGLRLYKPEYRDRFILHTHLVDDADYFDGEMAGGVHGVGLRSLVYWSNWVRTEVYSWMLAFCEATGMMDLLIFNYPSGNDAAKKAAESNAKIITGKLAIACPRNPSERYPAVETVPANAAGMESLKGIITDVYESAIERLIVGQSMSSGNDTDGSLGGTGKAEFAKATKAELLEWDTDNLDETLTTDLIGPLLKWNYPGVDFPVRFKSSIPDPEADTKLANGQIIVAMGVPVRSDELRQAAGFTKPAEGDEIAGQPKQPGVGGKPGAEGGSAPTQDGKEGGDKEPSLADLFERLKSMESLIRYTRDTHGHEHAGKGEGGGRFVGKGGSAASDEGGDKKPGRPKAEFHHEHTADAIEDAAKKLRGALNAAYHGKMTDEKLAAYADKWQRVMGKRVGERYREALDSVKAKLEADFGSAATESDDWKPVRQAFLLASGYVESRVSVMADAIRQHAGNEHFDTDELKQLRRDFEYEVADLRVGISNAHNAIYDALKPLRDRLAGDKKGQYKLGRYFYAGNADPERGKTKPGTNDGSFAPSGGGKSGSAARKGKKGGSERTGDAGGSVDRVASKVKRLLPSPDELKQLAESGDSKQTRQRQDALDSRWEEVIRIALGKGWKPGGSGNKPADFKGSVRLKSGEECPIIGDGKIVASKKQTYSVRDQAVRNKLVESARNPHSIVTILAVNYSPEATPDERGVYLVFGAPGSISLKNQGTGTKSDIKPVRILDGDELDRLGEPGVMSRMKSRYTKAIRNVDLTRYKAMEKAQARQRNRRDSANNGKIAQASLAMGSTSDEVAEDVCSGLDGLPEDVKRKIIERLSKKEAAK